jgi:hypothetical protein
VDAGVSGLLGVGPVGFFGVEIATPTLHTVFLPFFIQLYFFPAKAAFAPSFEHVAPALTAAFAGGVNTVAIKEQQSSSFMYLNIYLG